MVRWKSLTFVWWTVDPQRKSQREFRHWIWHVSRWWSRIRNGPFSSFSFPESRILLISAKNRDIWPALISSPRYADVQFCASGLVPLWWNLGNSLVSYIPPGLVRWILHHRPPADKMPKPWLESQDVNVSLRRDVYYFLCSTGKSFLLFSFYSLKLW